MKVPLSQAEQDYLKAIYRLSNRYGRAATSQLANWLEIKPASVTGMLRKLAQADPPLIAYKKHKGATLTPDGERAALEMIRHHRLIELYLHEKLGYAWDEVHEEAERLEHAISEEMEARMAAALGHPCRDPHGDPIPDHNLEMIALSEFPLSELGPGQPAVVRRVRDEEPSLLQYLDLLGIRPSTQVTAVAHNKHDHTLTLQIAGQERPVVIPPRAASELFVDLME